MSLLAPYCLVTGYVLTVACQMAGLFAQRHAAGIGRVYLLDNLGNVLGGLAFLVVLVHLLNHFGMLYFAAVLNLLSAVLVAAMAGKRLLAAAAATILLALLGVMARFDLNDISRRLEYAGQEVVFHGYRPTAAWW